MPDDARSAKNIDAMAKVGGTLRFDIAAVETSVNQFKQAAEQSAATTTLTGTISRLRPHLLALRAKGWSLPLLAAMVTEDGFPIDAATLGSYLRRLERSKSADRHVARSPNDQTDGWHETARLDRAHDPLAVAPAPTATPATHHHRSVVGPPEAAASTVNLAIPSTIAPHPEPAAPAVSPLSSNAEGNFKITTVRPQRRV